MELQVKGKNLPVTDALHEHAERKLQRLAKVLPQWDAPPKVELELSVEKNPKVERSQIAEITVRTRGSVLRACEHATDMYAAIDQASRKLERQAVRYRERRRKRRLGADHDERFDPLPEDLQVHVAEPAPSLVKRKEFALKAMSADDAALQMDMLHHDFFVFRDSDSGEVNVVYRRHNGGFGLIVPT